MNSLPPKTQRFRNLAEMAFKLESPTWNEVLIKRRLRRSAVVGMRPVALFGSLLRPLNRARAGFRSGMTQMKKRFSISEEYLKR